MPSRVTSRGTVVLIVVAASASLSLLIAAVVMGYSLDRPPKYDASTVMLVDAQVKSDGRPHPIPTTTFVTLERAARKTAVAIETCPVAEEAIRRLGLQMSPEKLLDNLTAQQVEGTRFVRLTYTDTDPERARRVVNTVGEEVSGHRVVEGQAGSYITAALYHKASVPDTPVSPKPLRNGLIALVAGLALSGSLIAGRELWRNPR